MTIQYLQVILQVLFIINLQSGYIFKVCDTLTEASGQDGIKFNYTSTSYKNTEINKFKLWDQTKSNQVSKKYSCSAIKNNCLSLIELRGSLAPGHAYDGSLSSCSVTWTWMFWDVGRWRWGMWGVRVSVIGSWRTVCSTMNTTSCSF